ncbi:uncharacterized protein [Sylvia atricapilla]|uniref:uncharacterized protein n=1 Tax=Sylvia atricapilla TaxID=48155 RepID=UPI003393D889
MEAGAAVTGRGLRGAGRCGPGPIAPPAATGGEGPAPPTQSGAAAAAAPRTAGKESSPSAAPAPRSAAGPELSPAGELRRNSESRRGGRDPGPRLPQNFGRRRRGPSRSVPHKGAGPSRSPRAPPGSIFALTPGPPPPPGRSHGPRRGLGAGGRCGAVPRRPAGRGGKFWVGGGDRCRDRVPFVPEEAGTRRAPRPRPRPRPARPRLSPGTGAPPAPPSPPSPAPPSPGRYLAPAHPRTRPRYRTRPPAVGGRDGESPGAPAAARPAEPPARSCTRTWGTSGDIQPRAPTWGQPTLGTPTHGPPRTGTLTWGHPPGETHPGTPTLELSPGDINAGVPHEMLHKFLPLAESRS